jgi:UDP-N-acetylenolpyruvoylglucosamine reductase
MGLVKSVGDKLDSRIKSGEIKESELISEATDIMNKMKGMPGMENIQSMLGKMGIPGLGGKGTKMNMGAMEAQMNKNLKSAQMRERMKAKAEAANLAKAQQAAIIASSNNKPQQNTGLTEEQLISVFSTGEKVERTPRGAKPPLQESTTQGQSKGKKKKGKK